MLQDVYTTTKRRLDSFNDAVYPLVNVVLILI